MTITAVEAKSHPRRREKNRVIVFLVSWLGLSSTINRDDANRRHLIRKLFCRSYLKKQKIWPRLGFGDLGQNLGDARIRSGAEGGHSVSRELPLHLPLAEAAAFTRRFHES
jgi:hypothetical protein